VWWGGGGGYGVLGLRQINTCRKVPLQVNFLRYTFCIAFYESSVSSNVSIETGEMDAGLSFYKYVEKTEKYCTLWISYSVIPILSQWRFFPVLSSETLLNVAFLCIQSVVLSLPVSTHPQSPPRQTKKYRIGRLALISLVMQYFIKGSVTVCNEK
jgi:hypothetical protein